MYDTTTSKVRDLSSKFSLLIKLFIIHYTPSPCTSEVGHKNMGGSHFPSLIWWNGMVGNMFHSQANSVLVESQKQTLEFE